MGKVCRDFVSKKVDGIEETCARTANRKSKVRKPSPIWRGGGSFTVESMTKETLLSKT